MAPSLAYRVHEEELFQACTCTPKLRPGKTQLEADATSAQRVKQREKALDAMKKTFLEERTIERLGAAIQARVDYSGGA